jgi:taurine dioxygenase
MTNETVSEGRSALFASGQACRHGQIIYPVDGADERHGGARGFRENATLPYQSICVEPVSPNIGAEVSGIDLTKPLSSLEVQELHDAIAEYLVLFFRDQNISPKDLKALGQHFGELHEHVGGAGTTMQRMKEDPMVRVLHYDENSDQIAGGEVWHTDQSCASIPPMGSILYLHTVPPKGGGDTMFASMYAAYDAMSERMKRFLEALSVVHDGTRAFGPGAPVATHPLIVKNPLTGRKSIFITPFTATKIIGLPPDEGAAVIAFLGDHCAHPDFQCRFRWRPHSIAFWDNRYTHHRALWDYYPNVRAGFRVQIQGTAPPISA